MITKTLVIAAVIIAAVAVLAIAPIATQIAEATHRPGHEGNPKTSTETTCIHNGTLLETDCPPPGSSGTTVTTTCTGHGRHITCTTS